MSTTFDRDTENRRLLATARAAVEATDFSRARALLSDLHTYAHDDADVHAAIHRLDFRMARAEGDARAMLAEVLPVIFASSIARLERRAPAAEVEVRIAAPREVVYDVLTDFDAYSEWNPWITHATGRASVGAGVEATVVLGERTMQVGHRVLAATPNERFAWCDLGWFTAVARGRRLRTLIAEGNATRLVTRLVVVGPLARLAWALEGENMRRGLGAESAALARRAESLVGADAPRVDA